MSIKIHAALAAALLFVLLAPHGSARAVVAPASEPQAALANPGVIGMVVRDPWYEFNTNPAFPNAPNEAAQDRMGAMLADAGVRWVRIEFIVRDEDKADWQAQIARNDYFIKEVAPRHGLKVMGLLGFALVDIDPRDPVNGLVVKTTTDPIYGGGVNPWMRKWLDRALYVAKHYEAGVAAYEILNEHNRLPSAPRTDNHPGYRGGEGIDPVLAARIHTKFFRCFKQNQCYHTSPPAESAWRAATTVILGGLHPRGSDCIVPRSTNTDCDNPESYVKDRDYLAATYRSEPFTSYFTANKRYPLDGLGFHPYPAEIRDSLAAIDAEVLLVTTRLDAVRELLRNTLKATDPTAAEIPFWITEIGYNAGYPGQDAVGQASFLRQVFTALAKRSDVAAIFWFKYEDFPPAAGVNAQQWGIVRVPFTEDERCLGGACYAIGGEPVTRRESFFVLRELAGLPVSRKYMPLVGR
jgi:hypothetical protein